MLRVCRKPSCGDASAKVKDRNLKSTGCIVSDAPTEMKRTFLQSVCGALSTYTYTITACQVFWLTGSMRRCKNKTQQSARIITNEDIGNSKTGEHPASRRSAQPKAMSDILLCATHCQKQQSPHPQCCHITIITITSVRNHLAAVGFESEELVCSRPGRRLCSDWLQAVLKAVASVLSSTGLQEGGRIICDAVPRMATGHVSWDVVMTAQ